MNTPQEEAERRWPTQFGIREVFIAGAEFERERLWPLVEAARAYRATQILTSVLDYEEMRRADDAANRLLAAAAALDAEKPPE